MSELTRNVSKWRRAGATRCVLQPSGRVLPLTSDTRSEAVSDLAGDSEVVEAYKDEALVGVWRRPVEVLQSADPLASIGAVMSAQATFFKEMMGLQVAAMRSVREAIETSAALRPQPSSLLPDESDDGQGERDEALLAALMRGAPPTVTVPPAANGRSEGK